MIQFTDEEILTAINEGRKSNKRDRRDGKLLSVAPEYMQDKRYVLKAHLKRIVGELEEYIFYVDSRGYIALKPEATKNWQALLEATR